MPKIEIHESHTVTNLMCTTCGACSCKHHQEKDWGALINHCKGRRRPKKLMPMGYTPK